MDFAYNVKRIEEVLQDFYRVTKIKTVLYNSDFSVITAVPYNECSFCTALNRVPAAGEKCNRCTRDSLQQCREKRKLSIYHCHAGLIEAVAPILIEDIIVGYIMLGQVRQEFGDSESIIAYAEAFIGEDARPLLEELDPKSDSVIRAAVRLMESCVCYLLMNKFIQEKQGNLLLQLQRYIEENPATDLSTNGLCERFSISRNTLYRLSNTFFGMPIATYVRSKRLGYAEQLIRHGVSVTRAAEQAGFYDYGYFGKIFKRYIGKTPLKAKEGSR